jgi:mRNA interferase RelE/StbE
MVWTIEFERAALRDLDKLGSEPAKRILRFLKDRLAPLDDPRSIGEALKGSILGDFWR